MADSKVALQLRIDDVAHKKLKEISTKELRSLNSQIEYFILQGIKSYENEYGLISIQG